MKKGMMAGLIVLMGLVFLNAAHAVQTIRLFIKGEQVHSDVPAQIINGRTLVPLRLIAEHLHEDVRWDERSRTVTVAPDVWEQELLDHISRRDWVYARNVVIRYLMAFDEKDDSGKQLVSEDFDTNLIGPEVIIPHPGVGIEDATMADFKFVDAWFDESAKDLLIRVKIWTWPYYYPVERVEMVWDFTVGMDREDRDSFLKIKKVWRVKEEDKEITRHHVFPGLRFVEEEE